MRLKTKIILAFALLAAATIVISVGFSLVSLSRHFERVADEDLQAARRSAEGIFFDSLGELVRKALFMSELQEVTRSTDAPDALYLSLEVKGFLFSNINIRIVTPDSRVLLTLQNAQQSLIDPSGIRGLDFFQPGRDPLLREGGMFAVGGGLCMAAISPIIHPDTFALKGFILLEQPLNAEFAALLKERSRADLVICSTRGPVASTLIDGNGEMVFPPLPGEADRAVFDLPSHGGQYRLARFAIEDIRKRPAGWVWVAIHTGKLRASQRVSTVYLILAALLTSLLMLLTSIYLGRRLSAPIQTLARGADAIARGQYDVELNVRRRDEIGDLAGTLGRMASSIRQHRQEILELQQFFEKVVEFSPWAIIIGNELGEVVSLNPAAAALVNLQQAEFRGRPLFENATLRPLKEYYFEVMLSGRPFSHDHLAVSDSDGGERSLRLLIYKVELPRSPVCVVQIEDVTEAMQLEEKLVHAQKLGTLGELLSRFTHEFNNLMTSMLGHLTLLRRDLRPGQPGAARAQLVEEIAVKAQQLGRDILDFSRREKPVRQPVDVAEAIDTVLNLLGKTVLKRIDVTWRTPTGAEPRVFIQREKFLLALFNLLINARDAITAADRDSGRIRLSAERIFLSHQEKHFVRLRIGDNGTGIDEKTLARVFEPYFTTKKDKGTGLGLTTVKEIVEENGGWIEIETEVGTGTTLIVFLPEYVPPEPKTVIDTVS